MGIDRPGRDGCLRGDRDNGGWLRELGSRREGGLPSHPPGRHLNRWGGEVAWIEPDGVATRVVQAGSGIWGPTVRIATELEPREAELAVNADGDSALLWSACYPAEPGGPDCPQLLSATRAADSGGWVVREVTSHYFEPFEPSYGIDIDALGVPTAIWVDADYAVIASTLAGDRWQTPQELTAAGTEVDLVGRGQAVALDVDTTGRAAAAWRGTDPPGCSAELIEVAVRAGDPAAWQSPIRLASPRLPACDPDHYSQPPAWNPAVLVSAGTVHLAWSQRIDGSWKMQLVSLDNTGAIPARATFAGDGDAAMAANEARSAVALWTRAGALVASLNG